MANPRRVLMAGCFGTVAVGLLMGPMLGSGSLLLVWAWLSAALFVMGFVYGPLGAFLPSLFPPRVRYSGASIAFNVGGIIGGGLAPSFAKILSDQGGLAPVGWYLAAAGVLSLIGLVPLRERYVEAA
jgi:MFS family permease